MLDSVPSDVTQAADSGTLAGEAARNWIVKRSLLLFGVAAAMATVLTALLLLAIGSGVSLAAQAVLGPFAGTAAQSAGSPGSGDLAGLSVRVLGLVFFTSHLAPYSFSLGPYSGSLFGVGSLTIPMVIAALAFQSGRALERSFPGQGQPLESALRASLLAVPYGLCSLLLFLASQVRLDAGLFGSASAGPSGWALVTPLIVAGLPAAAGAAMTRGVAGSDHVRFAVRGTVVGLATIGLGAAGAAAAATVLFIVAAATGQPEPAGPASGISSLAASAGSASGASQTLLFSLLGLLPFYAPNLLAFLWGGSLSLQAATWGAGSALMPLFAMAAALAGSVFLRRRNDHVEQVAFAASFAFGSTLLAILARPVVADHAFGPEPGLVLLAGLVLGGALAVVGPHLRATPFGAAVYRIAAIRPEAMPSFTEESRPGPRPGDPGLSVPEFELRIDRAVAIGLAAAGALIAVLVGAHAYLSSITSPEAAVSEYVAAEGRNDAASMWAHLAVVQQAGLGSMGQGAPVQALTGESDLQAMLRLPENRHGERTSIETTRLSTTGATTSVRVRYREGGRSFDQVLNVRAQPARRFLLYPDWKLEAVPGVVTAPDPPAGGRLTLDGTAIQPGPVAVLGGAHRLAVPASGPFAEYAETVLASPGQAATVSSFRPRFSDAGQRGASGALTDFFTQCAQATSAAPRNCPQSVYAYGAKGFQWTLTGDPTSHLDVAVDQQNRVLATGHYQMSVAYTDYNGALTHRLDGGPYQAELQWTGQGFTVGVVQRTYTGTDATPPAAASNDAILAAVRSALQACASITTVGGTPDCPQSGYAYQPANVRWTLKGDPMTAARVTFNGQRGSYEVLGDYTMGLSYDTASSSHQSEDRSGHYTAEVVWNDGKATVVDITGN